MTNVEAHEFGGVRLPDSRMAREAAELVRGIVDELLWNHSHRVFLFGALRTEGLGRPADRELLYVGALFHDVGLVEGHRSDDLRFEVDGANAAAAFLAEHGVGERDVEKVWDAVALHTTPGIPEHKSPEVAGVTYGVELDVLGLGFDDVDAAVRDEIVRAYPRPDFKRQIVEAFGAGIAHKPETAFGNVKADVLERTLPGYVRPNFCTMIERSPWPE
ncbi:MAG TPA: HD domain-containing protein [Solirubrobacteraceae bacterium]|nr:HD domain-containing protein [Solirubrobacteraceae bacterium]